SHHPTHHVARPFLEKRLGFSEYGGAVRTLRTAGLRPLPANPGRGRGGRRGPGGLHEGGRAAGEVSRGCQAVDLALWHRDVALLAAVAESTATAGEARGGVRALANRQRSWPRGGADQREARAGRAVGGAALDGVFALRGRADRRRGGGRRWTLAQDGGQACRRVSRGRARDLERRLGGGRGMSEATARAGTGCPPAWALQRYAACPEEAEAGTAEHVAVCPRCQDFVAERRAEGAAYMRSSAADALRQRLAQAEGAKAVVVRPRAWAWGGVLAAAAAVAISFSSAGPEQADSDPRAVDGLNPKGMAQLALFVGDEGQAPSELEAPATLLPGT